MRKARAWISGGVLFLAALLLALWWARAAILAEAAKAYFRAHGVAAQVSFSEVGFSSVTGSFALGPRTAPEFSARGIVLAFDPARWTPTVTEVRLIRPVIRAEVMADGRVRLGSLQAWLGALGGGAGSSKFVSPDLKVSLDNLRLLAATPLGPMEWDGDIRLSRNVPISVHLRMRPARLTWKGADLALQAINLDYQGPQASIRMAGTFHYGAFEMEGAIVQADVSGLRREKGLVRSRSARLLVSGRFSARQIPAVPLQVEITARDPIWSPNSSAADVRVRVAGAYLGDLDALTAVDPALARALKGNLARLNMDFAARVAVKGGDATANLTAPLTLEGAKGAVLSVPRLALARSSQGWNGNFDLRLGGPGIPDVKAEVQNLAWRNSALSARTQLNARFDYGGLRGARLSAAGAFSWMGGKFAFAANNCARLGVAAFRAGAKTVLRDASLRLCPRAGPLLAGDGKTWHFTARATEVKSFLPLASVALDGGDADLSFEGKGSRYQGQIFLRAARLNDRSAALRFRPLTLSGRLGLARNAWRGRIAVAGGGASLGEVTFTHSLKQGSGTAHILAPELAFAAQGFQPKDISPLLDIFRSAQGKVAFDGDLSWSPKSVTSHGILDVGGLDFVTALGRAHALKTRIVFSSLLPPRTEGTIPLTVSKVDWVLPITDVAMRFSVSPSHVAIASLSADWDEGHVAFDPFAVPLGKGVEFSGAARLQGISLGGLVQASNLGSRLKLTGTVSGRVPFTLGSQGIRIANGTIEADGPGRLSVDRALWLNGDAAISSNAVQDFAYQALENLAFSRLNAGLNSAPGGRLEILFHIKGKSAPPKPQTAKVSVLDILNGTALYKPIPLPSGTPIDLTLDTSLNFDELLNSYRQAWSEVLSPHAK